jgi:hypothetical protein
MKDSLRIICLMDGGLHRSILESLERGNMMDMGFIGSICKRKIRERTTSN